MALCACTNLYAAPIARLTLQSDPGDWIGGGQAFDIVYTPQTSDFFLATVLETIGNPPGQPAYVQFTLGTSTSGADNTFAGIDFGTDQLGIPLVPGTYSSAQRAPFASPGFAGLRISFQNRECNTLTGSFTITEASFGIDALGQHTIQHFAASFVQHCEGSLPALYGTFYFDALGLPPDPPRPIPALSRTGVVGIAVLIAFLGVLFLWRRDGLF